MPEIWLNYGIADVVLDIQAENLSQKIDSQGKTLSDEKITEKLGGIDLKKPSDLVVLHNSKSVQKIISQIFTLCEQKSAPIPRILADAKIKNAVKSVLPEGSLVHEFDSIPNANLIFLAEMELDGLFGYETIATRLLRRFGKEDMLSAYAKRKDNLPSSGQITSSIDEAKKFADKFEIQAIEIAANSQGIADFEIGHPSKTLSLSKTFESVAVKDAGKHKSMIISTGKDASNDTLGRAMNSLWNCSAAMEKNGLAILLAESKLGIGSEAVRRYIEGRLSLEQLRNPSEYVDGMEDLLFLTEIQKNFQIGLVSILPEFYSKKLNMISLNGVKLALDYILKTQGPRQKITIVTDGARTLLR